MASTEAIARLEAQIAALNEASSKISSLRSIPPQLLQPPAYGLTGQACYLPDFSQFQQISDLVKSEPVQSALKASRDSQAPLNAQESTRLLESRHNIKRRRISPQADVASPAPFKKSLSPTFKRRRSLFPATTTEPPLRRSQLPEFIRTFNKEHDGTSSLNMELKFWRRTRPIGGHPPPEDIDGVTILRFRIPDVLTVYITVTTADDKGESPDRLYVESVTGFGPREQVPPHSQSAYTVYQTWTQHVAQMLQSDPTICLQGLMDLLVSYQHLFIDKCKCGRVTSAEGHHPPVARVWLVNEETGRSCWMPRHVGCR